MNIGSLKSNGSNNKERNAMLVSKHYYCSNCNYHGEQEIQITNKSEVLISPKCPVCKHTESYNDILDYRLQDDNTEPGGIAHSEYTLGEYIQETDIDAKLNENNLKTLNQCLKSSGIKPIPTRLKIDYKNSKFNIDGLILEDTFSETEIIKINQFLDYINDIKILNNIKLIKEKNDIKKIIYKLIDSTIDSFVYDVTNYDNAYYTRDEFLNNIDQLTILTPETQHELLYLFLYDESNLKTVDYYIQNKDIFIEQYLNILT